MRFIFETTSITAAAAAIGTIIITSFCLIGLLSWG